MTFALDFYAARSEIAAALAAYPLQRNPDAGLTAAQRKHRRGTNFMTDERLSYRTVGRFTVEISTGIFLQSRMVGLTVYRLGGERENDSDLCACVHTVSDMLAHLDTLAREA